MGWAEDIWNSAKQKVSNVTEKIGNAIDDGISFVKDNASAVVHTALDVAGFIPVVGTVADVANAAIYAAEGDWKNAGLSALSAIPGIGDGIAAVSKSTKVVKAAKTISKVGKAANEAVGLYGDLKAAASGDLSGIGMRLLFAKKGKAKTGATSKKAKKKKSFFKKTKKEKKHICLFGRCFTGDTLICTKEGYVPIQNIRVGDDIYSRNEKTGETGFQKVEEIFLNHAHTIYTIEVDTKTKIKTTAYHPFYVEGEGWVTAIQLQVGAMLQTMNGSAAITNLRKERTEEAVPVYNFHVTEWVSYFVSELDVYVHNTKGSHSKKSKTKKSSKKSNKLPDWLKKRFEEGNNFNKENRPCYPYNEVEVDGKKKYVVDSYIPGSEIVSRKYTQLADVKDSTAIGYLNELQRKYPSGATITDSPFNPKALRGETLTGDLFLEVPVQSKPIPQSVIDAANNKGITIKDVTGKEYN